MKLRFRCRCKGESAHRPLRVLCEQLGAQRTAVAHERGLILVRIRVSVRLGLGLGLVLGLVLVLGLGLGLGG